MGSKIRPKFVNFWVQFWPFFFEVLELFGCLLGAFLGLLRLSWEASRAKKCRQSNAKTTFWKCSFFGLWSSGPKMDPKMVPKRDPKSDQKMDHEIIQKLLKTKKVLDSKMGSMLKKYRSDRNVRGLRKMFFRRCSQDGFKIAQDSFKQPKIDPRLLKNRSKLAQAWTRGAPRSQP